MSGWASTRVIHHDRWLKSNRRPRSGFVLALVLVTILVAGLALTRVAHQTLEQRRSILQQKESIQRRWGMWSCQQTLLPAAEGAMDDAQTSMRRTRGSKNLYPSRIRGSILLGEQRFDLELADENAKANINTLELISGGKVASTVARLVPIEASRFLSISPRPSGSLRPGRSAEIAKALQEQRPLVYTSWGSVFHLDGIKASGASVPWPRLTQGVCLFGDGRLNVFRAEDRTLLDVCSSVVTDGLARRILERVRESSLQEVELILNQVVTNAEDRQALQLLLAERSSCFSLWVTARSRNEDVTKWSVRFPNELGSPEVLEFLMP